MILASVMLVGVGLLFVRLRPYCVAKYRGQNADLRGATLLLAPLAAADLRGANLTHANLRGANLVEADWSGPLS